MPLPRITKKISGYVKPRSKPLSKSQYKAVAKVANRVINRTAEKKFLDTDHGTINANSTGGVVVTKITGPAQGDGASTRDGDQYYVKSLSVKFLADCGTNRDTQQRYILLQWMEDDSGGAPAIGDILNNTTNADLPTSNYVLNPQKKFKILYDRVHCFNANADNVAKMVSIYVPSKKLARAKISCDSAATTGEGMFYLITMGTQATGACKAVQSRLRFLDN